MHHKLFLEEDLSQTGRTIQQMISVLALPILCLLFKCSVVNPAYPISIVELCPCSLLYSAELLMFQRSLHCGDIGRGKTASNGRESETLSQDRYHGETGCLKLLHQTLDDEMGRSLFTKHIVFDTIINITYF